MVNGLLRVHRKVLFLLHYCCYLLQFQKRTSTLHIVNEKLNSKKYE